MNVFNHFMPTELIDIIFKFAHNGKNTYIQDLNIMIYCQKYCQLSYFNDRHFPFYLFSLLCIQAKKYNNIHKYRYNIQKYYYRYDSLYSYDYFYLHDFLKYK